MSVFANVIKPQGLEPLQFPTKFRSHSMRIDLGCMRAVTSAGRNVLGMLKEILESVAPARIRWRKGRLLLLDNWQVLHGRDSTEVPDAARTLGRTLIRNEDT